MEKIVLNAEERIIGKGSLLTEIRASKKIPGVIYGGDKKNVNVSAPKKEFLSAIHGESGLNAIITLKIKSATESVIVHELQRDPISRDIIHIDFYRIKLTEKITVNVPVHLHGKAVGQEQGGVVDHRIREVEVECLPDDIPPHFDVDISALNIGEAIGLNEITIPKSVKLLSDPEAIVVHVVTADKEEPKPEPTAEEAAAEPEVIGKGLREKDEADGAETGKPAGKEEKTAKQSEEKEKK